jgi:hypothetical protein
MFRVARGRPEHARLVGRRSLGSSRTPADHPAVPATHAAATRSAAIGDVVELELTKMRNPVTHAEAHPEVLLPEGLVVKRGGLAASAVFRVKDELALDHSGQYAAFGRFQYS